MVPNHGHDRIGKSRRDRAWAECRSGPARIADLRTNFPQFPELQGQAAKTLLAPPVPARPRLVLQAMPSAPVAIVAWRADSRLAVAVTTAGEALVWNRAGELVERRKLQITSVMPTLAWFDRDYIHLRYWETGRADQDLFGVEEQCWRIGSSTRDRNRLASGWGFLPLAKPLSVSKLGPAGRLSAINAVADRSFTVGAPDHSLAIVVDRGLPKLWRRLDGQQLPLFRPNPLPAGTDPEKRSWRKPFDDTTDLDGAFLRPDLQHIAWAIRQGNRMTQVVDFDLEHAVLASRYDIPEPLQRGEPVGWISNDKFGLKRGFSNWSIGYADVPGATDPYFDGAFFSIRPGEKTSPVEWPKLKGADRYLLEDAQKRLFPEMGNFRAYYSQNMEAVRLAVTSGDFNLYTDDGDSGADGLFRLYLIPDSDRFFAVTNDGLYDTNLPSDSDRFRWALPEPPTRFGRTYAPQTFMRDYFQPDLMAKLMACGRQGKTRAQCFPNVPDVTKLNRVLPEVNIDALSDVQADGTVQVTVSARATTDPSAPKGQQASGLYNLRLFMDDQLVAEVRPPNPALDPKDFAGWRRDTAIAGGRITTVFSVRLPTLATASIVRFGAYAFNRDRIKSETGTAYMWRPDLPPGRSRLWLLAIGINDYGGGGFQSLRYAAPDAKAIIDKVKAAAQRQGRTFDAGDIIDASLTGRVTKAEIEAAFRSLSAAGPDDVVLISYSGHGFTDARGRFFLVPSDGALEPGTKRPVGLISAAELSAWLGPVNAAETSMIIDACHSAASVSANGFKPGPMGEPGLGQLAFDKGIRILAASAPEQVAMEQSAFGHGLLTYAFAEEAIGQGKAAPSGAATSIAAAMRYAAERVPVLGEPGTVDALPPMLVSDEAPPAVVIQRPRLFDFRQDDGVLAFAAPTPAAAGTPAASGTALH